MKKDPYEVLGVSHTASDEEIEQAYRNLLRKFDPQRYKNSSLKDISEQKLREVSEAYNEIKELHSKQIKQLNPEPETPNLPQVSQQQNYNNNYQPNGSSQVNDTDDAIQNFCLGVLCGSILCDICSECSRSC